MAATPPENAPERTLKNSTWCVIGGGNMARAIVQGATASGQIRSDRFVVVEPDSGKRGEFESAGVRTFDAIGDAAASLGRIETSVGSGHFILAVKPQNFPQIAADVRSALDGMPRRVVSIMAGIPSAHLERVLGPGARVLRLMPNTPAQIRKGITAWVRGRSAQPGDEAQTTALFATLGFTIELEERLFDAFTAVAGSGPAYVFYLAEALMNAARSEGIDRESSSRIVRAVLSGSSELLQLSPDIAPSELRNNVTSKGGTTEAAIRMLDEKGVRESIESAVAAAAARGKTLADGLSRP